VTQNYSPPLSALHVLPEWQSHDLEPDCACRPIVYVEERTALYVHRCGADDPPRYMAETDPARLSPGRRWLVIDALAMEPN
jgi:hypothetical protein